MMHLKRRGLIKTCVFAAAASVVGIFYFPRARKAPTPKGEPSMTDQKLIESIDAIFGKHMEAELAGDLDKTLATMTDNPHLVNVPTMVGGQGAEGVRTFYAKRLIGQFFPPDVQFETISRTYSPQRLIDELIISFTHTIEMDHLLPGVKPTGKFVEVAFVVIVGIEDGKVSYEHIHWDQANVLVQIGLLDPTGLPVTGAGAAAKLRDPSIPDPFFNES
jgi:carboxymethylenebutenolidase